jgi:small subunit ribosomal protein S27e
VETERRERSMARSGQSRRICHGAEVLSAEETGSVPWMASIDWVRNRIDGMQEEDGFYGSMLETRCLLGTLGCNRCTHTHVSLTLSLYFLLDRLSSIFTMPVDLLNPTAEHELRTHKLKRLVQSPNSFFMDIKCPGCFQITTVFSHAQTVVMCGNCNIHLCEPTGGKARLTEGCSYRKKVE